MEKINNEYVDIEIKKSHKMICGDFSILSVTDSSDLYALVYKGVDLKKPLTLELKINGVLIKTYQINNDLFYVLLKKRDFIFIEVLISYTDHKDSMLLNLRDTEVIFNNLIDNGSLKIIKPRISVYTITWNEEKILPYFLKHYSQFASKITIFDNYSSDDTINIINKFNDCDIDVIPYNTNGYIDDFKYLEIKNNCWKGDPSEYVIVCDVDEFLYVNNVFDYLNINNKYDIFTPNGYEMVSDEFPMQYKTQIIEQVKNGMFRDGLCKSILFKPNMISDVNYTPGCHFFYINDITIKIKKDEDQLKLLHYKHLSKEYLIKRYELLANRLSDTNKKLGAGRHYLNTIQEISEFFDHIKENSQKVIDLNIKTRKVFIDAGARIGETVDLFLNKRQDLYGADVYFFECNLEHLAVLEDIANSNLDYNFFVKTEAVWNENTVLDFYTAIDQWGDLGNTLNPNKLEKLDLDNPKKVKAIKFSEFLSNFSMDDYVILKLDIEGAEYEVLWDLINSGEISKIKELYVEFHDNFFPGKNSNELKEIIDKIIPYVDYNWL